MRASKVEEFIEIKTAAELGGFPGMSYQHLPSFIFL
jgi:hypothetical protein